MPKEAKRPRPNPSSGSDAEGVPERIVRVPAPTPRFRNPEHRKVYILIKGRKVVATKFAHPYTLAVLGLETEVQRRLESIGIADFLSKSAPTYGTYTLEFLSSLGEDTRTNDDNGEEEKFITFRLLNAERSMSVGQIHEAFGWTQDFDEATYFNYFCHQSYNSSNARTTAIIHPVYRYFEKLAAGAILCKSELTKMNSATLQFLAVVSHRGSCRPLLVEHFIKRCFEIRGQGLGVINLGGMVTLLAKQLGIHIPETIAPESDNYHLDSTKLVKMEFIKSDPKTGDWFWLHPDGWNYMKLPNDKVAIDVEGDDNAFWVAPDDLLGQPADRGPSAIPLLLDGQGAPAPQWDPLAFVAAVERRFQGVYEHQDYLEDRMDEIQDQMSEMFAITHALHDFYLAQGSGYNNPFDDMFTTAMATRHSERQQRRDARQATRRAFYPDDSSSGRSPQ